MAKVRSHVDEKDLFAGMGGSQLLAGKPKEDNLRILFLGASHIKEKLVGATMPAFDEELDTVDDAYPTSVVPCWTKVPDAPRNPRDFVPSPWAVPLMFYTFVGPENRHFFAPQNRAKMISSYDQPHDQADLRDPFNDVRMLLKRGDKATFEYYTKGSATSSPLLPPRGVKYLSFAKVQSRDDKTPRVVIVSRTSTCRDFELIQMRWLAEGNPRQARWPRYLLGDVTDPNEALMWYVDKHRVDPKDPQDTNVLRWTEEMQILPPSPKTMQFSDSDLRLRFTFVDDACWNIPTYQEMLDVLVNELTDIPLETIKEACGRYGDVGAREGEPTTRKQPGSGQRQPADDETAGVLKSLGRESTLADPPPPMPEDDDIPFDDPSSSAAVGYEGEESADAPSFASEEPDEAPPPPPMTEEAPPPPDEAPPPPPPAAEPKVWACAPGGKPEKKTLVEAAAMPAGTQVNIDGVWKPVHEVDVPAPKAAPQPAKTSGPDPDVVRKTIDMILLPTGVKLDKLTEGQRRYVTALASASVQQRESTGRLDPATIDKLKVIASGGAIPEA